MTDTDEALTANDGPEAPPLNSTVTFLVRVLGWMLVALLAVYLVNNILTFWHGWPGAGAAMQQGGGLAWLQLLTYGAAFAIVLAGVARTPHRVLREDSQKITDINTFIVRAAFWSVLFVGLVDMAISFLRVENFLPVLFGAELAGDLGRSQFRGPVVHLPLIALGIITAAFTRTIGFHWLALLVVVAELGVVILRFVFSYEQAFMGDLVRFWYAALFLFASAYTLLEEGHVRVDVLYSGFAERTKGKVNAIGSILLGVTLCVVILAVGMNTKASIINSALLSYEVSQAGFGLYVKYLMAGFLGIFAITMLIQFASYLLDGVADWRGEPGKRHVEPSGH